MRAALLLFAVGFVAAPARAADHGTITAGMDCSACHSADGWKQAGGDGAGFDHARTGFPLTGGHRAVTCAGCHDGRPLTTACAGCHGATEPHAGRLGSACAECHTPVAWTDTQTLERHRRTRLPLTGKHAVIECRACHAATTERTWTNVPADCYACHEREYRSDIHPSHVGAIPFPRTCGQCHRTAAWKPATIDPTMLPRTAALRQAVHDGFFALSFGKHRGAACASCHPAVATAPRLVACTGCHAHDATNLGGLHRGRLVGTAAGDCLACHPGGVGR